MVHPPIATKGNFLHVYDFRVKPGKGDEFIGVFDELDHSGANPMHDSPAQVSEGVLCRDDTDPDYFYLIAEWNDKAAHRELRQQVLTTMPRSFAELLDGPMEPVYADVVA